MVYSLCSMKKIIPCLLVFFCLSLGSVLAQTVDTNQVANESDTSQMHNPRGYARMKQPPRIVTGKKANGIKASTNKPVEDINVPDSVLRKKHNPNVAACLAIIPGAGQIYNKKYWKLPIVYGALGISGYFVYDFAHQMNLFKNEFINRRDGHTEKLNPNYTMYTDENVLAMKNYYRRNMEIAIAVTTVLYCLNILDAYVDAHLYYFDISDDLSMHISPQVNTNYPGISFNHQKTSLSYGVGLTLNFK